MKGVARITDLSTPLALPSTAISGSAKTFADILGANRLGDAWTPHVPHPTPQTTVSASVKTFCDSKGWATLGDSISCGDTIATASIKTFSV